jgi:hypothetical protein
MAGLFDGNRPARVNFREINREGARGCSAIAENIPENGWRDIFKPDRATLQRALPYRGLSPSEI